MAWVIFVSLCEANHCSTWLYLHRQITLKWPLNNDPLKKNLKKTTQKAVVVAQPECTALTSAYAYMGKKALCLVLTLLPMLHKVSVLSVVITYPNRHVSTVHLYSFQ